MTRISEATQKFWIDTLLGWAEDRLMPPQFDECRRAVEQLVNDAGAERGLGLCLAHGWYDAGQADGHCPVCL